MIDPRPVVEAGAWVLGPALLLRVPAPPVAPHRVRPVAVVVPARDEEAAIATLLASLGPQLAPGDELVVVDDHSRDDTATVAAAAGATVVPAPDLPDGWTGKSWACASGAAATTAPLLVFLDADVTLAPDGLDRITGAVAEQGLVSVQPFHEMRRPYERLSLFFNLVAMMGTDAFGPMRRQTQPSGAFGPVLACTRVAYAGAGGHEAVRSSILDDVALARRFVDRDEPVRLFGGRGVASFRMYPGGFRQLAEGWTKNIASGAGSTRALTLLLVGWWITGCITAATGAVTHPAVYLAFAAQLWWLGRRVGRYGPVTAALYPACLLCFLAVFARSVALTVVRRRVSWKGRAIDLRDGR